MPSASSRQVILGLISVLIKSVGARFVATLIQYELAMIYERGTWAGVAGSLAAGNWPENRVDGSGARSRRFIHSWELKSWFYCWHDTANGTDPVHPAWMLASFCGPQAVNTLEQSCDITLTPLLLWLGGDYCIKRITRQCLRLKFGIQIPTKLEVIQHIFSCYFSPQILFKNKYARRDWFACDLAVFKCFCVIVSVYFMGLEKNVSVCF